MAQLSARGGFLDFSPIKKEDSPAVSYGNKENNSSHPVLSLIQFSRAPFVTFGNVKLGSSKSSVLCIENPVEDANIEVLAIHFTSSSLTLFPLSFVSQPEERVNLTITWTPIEEGGIRELITFIANGVVKHQAILLGRADAPKRRKKSLWDSIKSKKEFDLSDPPRGKKNSVSSLKMAANKTFHVSRTPQYRREKVRSPLASLNKKACTPVEGQKFKQDVLGQLSFDNVQKNSPVVILVPAAKLIDSSDAAASYTIPRHPMPFAAKNMFYDERWIEKQETGFTWWINYVLTPDDFKVNTEVTKVNAVSLAMGGNDKFAINKAPTKEEMSFSTYTARRRLNRLRRSACQLFTSEPMVKAIQRLELEVEARRLLVRKDRHLWKDIGERQKVLNWLLSYNPLWLRIGLETIYGEMISLESNSDVMGLAMFILKRLLWNPDIAAEFRHAKVPNLYKDGHEGALSRFTLKKLLLLVCFLDKAKESRMIEHDPCLFCMDAEFKTTKDLLLAFSRDFLSGEGILPRHLGYMGLLVSHIQTPLDEFNFAVKNLSVDLKCGIRLVRVMELFIQDWSLSRKLRMPAISRLQKVHNVDIALQVLRARGVDLKDEHDAVIDSRDIVDGHREKTLSLLWKIIFAFQVEVLLDEDQLRKEISFLKRTWTTKQRLASLRADKGVLQNTAKPRPPFKHSSSKITLLMEWVNAVCQFYHLKAENFTVSFSDGRILCYLIHHYHPSHLPADCVSHNTTQTVECSQRGRVELNSSSSDSDISFDTWPTTQNELLENEKNNFRLVNTAVSDLGGVPAMMNPADMSNTIPNEKVVTCYLSFLCARLLDLRNETRAARIIQGAWRKYRLKKDLKLYQNQAATVIQTTFMKFVARRKLLIQAIWRGRAERKRTDYLLVKKAAVTVQAWFRGMREKAAALLIQSAFRRHQARTRYNETQASAVTIQRWFRSCNVLRRQRDDYLAIREAAVKLQSAIRGTLARRLARRKRAAVKIQSVIRMSIQRRSYLTLRSSTVKLQSHCRAWVARRRFLMCRTAAATLQKHYRGRQVQRGQRSLYLKTLTSVKMLQARVRGHIQLKRYRNLKRSAVTIQVSRRRHAASTIQHAARTFLLRRREQRVQQGIIKAQALWRGHQSRKLHDNRKVVSMRHRLRKVSEEVREEDRLCNKTSWAIEYLLKYKHFSYILEALKNLETATRLSPECCEHLVTSGATLVIFTLIRSCNRSVPSMEVITYAIQVLLNLSKYDKTIEAVYAVENSVDTLLDLLQIYREKAGDKVADKGGSIFTKACFLLIILLQDQYRALEVRKLSKAVDRLRSIYRLTARKHKMDAERTVVKQKMGASINGSFIVPATPRKSKPVFSPDWVLRKDKLQDIVDPLRAVQMVADVFSIVL
uniref:Assembly factor for spindle microtubules n=1 Tax=Oncorhynchus kisutch TaxID=8019 RepID=A0A8C7MUR2_ONCKI